MNALSARLRASTTDTLSVNPNNISRQYHRCAPACSPEDHAYIVECLVEAGLYRDAFRFAARFDVPYSGAPEPLFWWAQ